MKIAIERLSTEERMEISVVDHSSLEEWVRIIKIILKWIDFTDETVNELFETEK